METIGMLQAAANSMGMGDSPMAQQGQPDLIQMLWRWKWLTLLGALLGIGVGYLFFLQIAPTYKAMATLQIISPQDDLLPLRSLETGLTTGAGNRADEIRVITSSAVLSNAVEIGRLNQASALAGMEKEEIVNWIRENRKLRANPGTKEMQTSIIDISFECEDPELSADVVRAVVAGYEAFLGKEYQSLGSEIIDQVTKARDEMDKKFTDVNQRYMEFRKQSALIYNGEEGSDPYAAALLAINSQLAANAMRMNKIEAALEQAREANEAQRRPEEILLMLSELVNEGMRRDNELANSRFSMEILSRDRAASEAERIENTSIFPLRAELNSLLGTVGEGHPQVIELQKRIKALDELVADVREREKSRRDELLSSLRALEVGPSSPSDQLKTVIGGLQEQLATLAREGDKLRSAAQEQTKMSQELQSSIAQNKLLNLELESTGAFRKQLDEAIAKIGLIPDYGRKSMKRLEISSIGEYSGPFSLRYLLAGALLGGLLFSALGYLLESVDRSFRSPDEIAAELAVPILGHIPLGKISNNDRKDDKVDLSVVTLHRSKSQLSEAFRGVRTGLYFNNRAGDIKVIQLTSPVPGDGKSTIAANLAVSMAQSGKKVALVDADFRRPRIAKLFGITDPNGVAPYLTGSIPLEQAIIPSSVENLSLLPSGIKPPNPAELLTSDRFDELLQILRGSYDYVIIDSPPLLAVSDPATIAARVDGVVLNIRLRRNLKPIAQRAVSMLQGVDARLLGVVVNGVGANRGYGGSGYRYGGYGGNYGYGYGYGYGGNYGSGGGEGVRAYYEDDLLQKLENRKSAS